MTIFRNFFARSVACIGVQSARKKCIQQKLQEKYRKLKPTGEKAQNPCSGGSGSVLTPQGR